jgi:hypothetical protein
VTQYSAADELRLRLHDALRNWVRSGLLSTDQGSACERDLRTDLRRTGLFLRGALAVFAMLAAGAAVLLLFVTLDTKRLGIVSVLCALLGAIAFAAADVLVSRFRFYRHGVEEALVVWSVALFGAAAALGTEALIGDGHNTPAFVTALLVSAGVSAAAYRRFGYQYAAVATMLLLVLLPAAFDQLDQLVVRLSIAVLAVAAFVTARAMRQEASEIAADDAATVAAVSLGAAYVALNLVLSVVDPASVAAWFRWGSFAAIWAMPALALYQGIKGRDVPLLGAGLMMALATLLTSKMYLGWPAHSWDPMVLGAELAAVAIAVRRWLASGPGGARDGFTPTRILQSDADALNLASLASAAIHLGAQQQPQPHADAGLFDGGRSGGGGGGATF